MKKIFFSGLFLLYVSFANATIWTVDNDTLSPGYPGQFSSIQAAHDSASAGDTILVYGTTLGYGNVLINKELTLIGPGFNPQGQNTHSAFLNVIELDTGSTNTVISGFEVSQIILSGNNISKIIIRGNQVYNSIIINGGDSIYIYKNIIASVNVNYHANVIIANNIFATYYTSPFIRNSNQSSVLIDHNLFTGGTNAFSAVSNTLISNNIFFCTSPQSAATSVFNNNLTYHSSTSQLPYGSNTGQNNLVSINPQFINVPIDNAMCQFSFYNDYRLSPSSPGKNAATDGTDIGVFGGSYPFPNTFPITGMQAIPFIYQMLINGSPFVPAGNSSINITVKSVNHN